MHQTLQRSRLRFPLFLSVELPGRILMVMLLAVVGTVRPTEAQFPPHVRNVLFIVSDDLKASALGCYGNAICRTPHLDELAKRSVVFDRAYCQGTVCGPSRTSFMFSRYQGRGSVTLAEHFRNHGHYTARVGKIFHMKVPGDIIAGTNGQDVAASWTERFNAPGFEAHTPGLYACLNLNDFSRRKEGRQSTAMPHRMFVSVQSDGDGTNQPDHRAAGKAIQLLNEHQHEPFFLAVGFVRPHYPMVTPKSYFDDHPWQQIPLPEVVENDLADIPNAGIPKRTSAENGIDRYPDNQRRMWQAYYASVSFMDQQVGRLLSELDRLGLRDSTAIVFTSDHGYHLGEHTFWQKNDLHEEVIRVPLMMSVPGYEPGRSDSIVELVDLFPTLTDLAGLPLPDGLHGVSLKPVLQNLSTVVKDGALAFARGTCWRTDRWAYMSYSHGEELYDMKNDPDQFHNLADDRDHAATLARLRSKLKQQNQRFRPTHRD